MFKHRPIIAFAAVTFLLLHLAEANAGAKSGCLLTPHDLPPPALPDGAEVQLHEPWPWRSVVYDASLPDGSVLRVDIKGCGSGEGSMYINAAWTIPNCEHGVNCDLAEKIATLAKMSLGRTPFTDVNDRLKRHLVSFGFDPRHTEPNRERDSVVVTTAAADQNQHSIRYYYDMRWVPRLVIVGISIRTFNTRAK